MVPPRYSAILARSELTHANLGSLRVLVSAGAPLTKTLEERLLARFGGALMELYGVTEGIGTTLKPDAIAEKLASVGTPIDGVRHPHRG